jgi:hypothetical protein
VLKLKSVYRDFNVNYGTGTMVDIKQRSIVVKKKTTENGQDVIVCDEPSPDALAVYAAELTARVDSPQKITAALY